MIVRYVKQGWEIITQRNHALLAAAICANWNKADQTDHWTETLLACSAHDDSFNELEQPKLLTPAGGPLNLGMGTFDEKLSKLLMNMAITKSSFTALLILKHIHFTHGGDPKAIAFLKSQKKKESMWLKSANVTIGEVNQAYEILEFCDAFSLLICKEVIQNEKRKMEISTGPDGRMFSVFAGNDCLIVKPWPFEPKEFEVAFEIRRINKLTFKSDHEFRNELYKTMPEKVLIKIKKD